MIRINSLAFLGLYIAILGGFLFGTIFSTTMAAEPLPAGDYKLADLCNYKRTDVLTEGSGKNMPYDMVLNMKPYVGSDRGKKIISQYARSKRISLKEAEDFLVSKTKQLCRPETRENCGGAEYIDEKGKRNLVCFDRCSKSCSSFTSQLSHQIRKNDEKREQFLKELASRAALEKIIGSDPDVKAARERAKTPLVQPEKNVSFSDYFKKAFGSDEPADPGRDAEEAFKRSGAFVLQSPPMTRSVVADDKGNIISDTGWQGGEYTPPAPRDAEAAFNRSGAFVLQGPTITQSATYDPVTGVTTHTSSEGGTFTTQTTPPASTLTPTFGQRVRSFLGSIWPF